MIDNSNKMEKYISILEKSWPKESLRPKMPLKDRAKIFLPFAALKGYEESLESVRKTMESDERTSTAPTQFLV